MATLVLKFDSKVIKEFPVQKPAVVIGRAPGNEIVIDKQYRCFALFGHGSFPLVS